MHRVLSFGAFRCDLSVRELHKNGIKVKMADQPFRLLAILLERRGEVVTRQELEQELWPGQAELDRADNLNTAIKKVRVALDDEAEHPRFIETVPRRGYSFIGRVECGGDNGNDASLHRQANGRANSAGFAYPEKISLDAVPLSNQLSPRPPLRDWKRAAIACAVVAVALFALWWFTPLPPPRITRIDQITYSARVDTPVKPVADGPHVYYIQRAGDHWDLMKTMLGERDGRHIEAPGKSAMVVGISPDGTHLLVSTFEKRDGNDELWMMPAQGGAANRFGVTAPSATFSPDGKRIAYANAAGVFVMDADGLNRRKLIDLGTLATWLSWSPDGEHLRFTISPPKDNGHQSIWEVSNDGTGLREMTLNTNSTSVCCGSWTNRGRYYVFSADIGRQSDIWAVREARSWRRKPWHAVQLSFGPNSAISPAAAGDERHVFYYSGVLRQELQRFDLRNRDFAPFSVVGDSMQLAYSRDGQWMAYIDADTQALFRCRSDGTDRLELSSSGVGPAFPRWSPDGKWIVFQGRAAEQSGAVYIVGAAGGPVQRLLATDQDAGDADWSNYGDRLVASRASGSDGSRELVFVDFSTKRTEEVPGAGHLSMSRWSPDGGYISATSDDQTQLKLYDLASKKWQVIARGEALGISVWAPDGRYLYFQDLLGSGERLRRYDMFTAKVETVVDFSEFLKSGVSRCALFGITPDGSPMIAFDRSSYDLFSAELTLP